MDFEFDRAERIREQERKKAEKLRKQREEQEARGRKIAEEAEKKRLAALQVQREREMKRREREEEEAMSAGGVRYMQFLLPIPLANLETDRVRLPPSALQTLIEAGAIGDSSRILTFELALFDSVNDQIISKTHCGVLEFTAQEGTIEIPIKAAMSLGKERGEGAIASWKLRVRYVAIDRYPKIRARVQPLGKGFHVDGSDTATIDLKTVLERVLSQQTTITQGDWIPVRNEGRTYTLAVQELEPEPQAVLVNTDVEIDLMPSEEVVQQQQEKERAEKERIARVERAQQLAASLPVEPPAGSPGSIAIKARLPESIVGTRRFDSAKPLSVVFAWAESLLGAVQPPAGKSELEIVQSVMPGQPPVIIGQDSASKSLRDVGFGRSENLNFRWRVYAINDGAKDSFAESKIVPTSLGDSNAHQDWNTVRENAESHLDRDLSSSAVNSRSGSPLASEGRVPNEERSEEMSSADMFRLLVAKGAEPTSAARICQKYLQSLRTLKNMNLLDGDEVGARAVELVEKFKGSTGRIADALLTAATSNEADDAMDIVQEPQLNASRWNDEIAILESMFTGRDRQELVQALEKHAGSLQKAVNELLS